MRSHPSSALLYDYERCRLGAGLDAAIEAHTALCADCRDRLAALARTQEPEPEPLSYDALDKAMTRIDADTSQTLPVGRARSPGWMDRLALPNSLDPGQVGRRRWPVPGVWIAPIGLDEGKAARTYLISVRKGLALPDHSHHGRELTVVLSGEFADRQGVYGPGDLIECDDRHNHAPHAVSDCVCLIAAEAPIVVAGLLGPLVRLAGV